MSNYLKKTDSYLNILIVIGIIACLNFLAYNFYLRLDLTQNKDYSLAQASRQFSTELKDIVNVKVYFSDRLPSRYLVLRQDVKDILEGYINYSKGKIKVQFISPEDDEKTKQELYAMGVPELQFNSMEKDKLEMIKGYLGVVVQYGDKHEAIPVVEDTENFEYQLTLAMKKVTGSISNKIGFIVDTPDEYKQAFKKLAEAYATDPINLDEEKSLDDLSALLILGGENLTDENLKKLDEFLMKNKSVLVFSNGVKVEQGLSASANKSKLNDLLAKYGLKINNDLVLDQSSGIASFSQGFFSYSLNYPFWPKVVKSGFNQEISATAQLENVIFPWASSVEASVSNEKTKTFELVKTSNRSWTQESNFNLNPDQKFDNADKIWPRTLVASLNGELKSGYSDQSASKAHLIVSGDSDFFKDRFLGQGDNLTLLQNLIDSVAMDEALINIRSKGVTDRPIQEITDNNRQIIRYGNLFGPAIIVILFGLSRYFLRNKK